MTLRKNQITIRNAQPDEHAALCRIARTSLSTRAFGDYRFSSKEAYAKGWIRVAEFHGIVVGLACVRHKQRPPETKMYFLVVNPQIRNNGIGSALLEDIKEQSPTGRIVLDVNQDDEAAVRFYMNRGFTIAGSSLKGRCWRMEWQHQTKEKGKNASRHRSVLHGHGTARRLTLDMRPAARWVRAHQF